MIVNRSSSIDMWRVAAAALLVLAPFAALGYLLTSIDFSLFDTGTDSWKPDGANSAWYGLSLVWRVVLVATFLGPWILALIAVHVRCALTMLGLPGGRVPERRA